MKVKVELSRWALDLLKKTEELTMTKYDRDNYEIDIEEVFNYIEDLLFYIEDLKEEKTQELDYNPDDCEKDSVEF